MQSDPIHSYVSRGGLKLRHALEAFRVDVRGLSCADFGCSTGGFTDCLLQAGAAHVTSIDTAYGEFAWKLRNDPRVTLLERTNALHVRAPAMDQRPQLIVIDLGWTPQRLCLPAALNWLSSAEPAAASGGDESDTGRIITLIKPHYELEPAEKSLLVKGVLPDAEAQRVAERVMASFPDMGLNLIASTRSPIAGSKENRQGNAEWLAVLGRARSPDAPGQPHAISD
ncbi:MAG: TlyA family RNA methyltransferase [Pyrinomonadaceae bacterium]|nr:TlyA family RNA methyltransferase [Phycisphaerales bacterium]